MFTPGAATSTQPVPSSRFEKVAMTSLLSLAATQRMLALG